MNYLRMVMLNMGYYKNKEIDDYEKRHFNKSNISYSDFWPIFRGELMSPEKMLKIILSEDDDKKEE